MTKTDCIITDRSTYLTDLLMYILIDLKTWFCTYILIDNEAKYQAILKKVDLPMVARSRCQEVMRERGLGPNFELHESFVCAGGVSGKDTCEVGISRGVFGSEWKQVKIFSMRCSKINQSFGISLFCQAFRVYLSQSELWALSLNFLWVDGAYAL